MAALRARPRSVGGHQAEDNVMLQDLLTGHKSNSVDRGQGCGVSGTSSRAGSTDFRKQLRWMIKNPPTDTVTISVTPQMADEMLGYNDRNRPQSPNTVRHYARQMKEGKWVYTRQPIIFSAEGRLIDGQHRLAACLESGVAFNVDVAFGAPDEAFSFIDIGKKRQAADIFAINGVARYSTVAAATGWVAQYFEQGDIGRNPGNHGRTPDELYQVFLKHPNIQESVPFGHRVYDAGLAAPAPMAAMHYICSRKSRRDADQFFTVLADGIGFRDKKDPIFKLHKTLQDNRAKPKDDRLSPRRIAAYTIKAWNAWRRNDTVSQFKLADGERFPRAR
jgi:hypothetical protein